MPRKPSPPKLAVVAPHPGATTPAPPIKLGEVGMSLWRDVLAAYEVFGPRLVRDPGTSGIGG
jgi:hypothetical protein